MNTPSDQTVPVDNRPPVILRPDELPRHERGGGASTIPLVTARTGATSFINGITEFGPGAVIAFHSHNCEESVMLLEGDAVLDINGEEHVLKPLDTTWLPPNVSHRFRNLSKERPMKILWIYASMQATRTITETGETGLVSAEAKR